MTIHDTFRFTVQGRTRSDIDVLALSEIATILGEDPPHLSDRHARYPENAPFFTVSAQAVDRKNQNNDVVLRTYEADVTLFVPSHRS